MNDKFPKKIILGNIPTKIEKLKLSEKFENIDLFIKRDDQTGFELSGNKVRKLEYIMYELKKKNIDRVITCGSVQSNHVRATSACAARLGLKCTALLKGDSLEEKCNYYMTKKFGAKVYLISDHEYKYKRNESMEVLKEKYETKNEKVYIIPEGASNALGNYGYFQAFKEILTQEKSPYDLVSVPVGSCGTYAGLYIGNEYYNAKKHILGINIYDDKIDYNKKAEGIIQLTKNIDKRFKSLTMGNIDIRNEYVGEGYGKTSLEVYEFMDEFAKKEGILLDPIYTGKGFYGFYKEMKKLDRKISRKYKALFIHTGGTFLSYL